MGVNAQLRDVDATRVTLLGAISSLAPTAAQWWQYSVSHGRFLLRLDGSAHSDYIIIGVLFARYISGLTHWDDPQIELVSGVDDASPAPDDLTVCVGDLTDEGLLVYRDGEQKWLQTINRGTAPADTSIL